MTAVLLAAGAGKRMGAGAKPKCLSAVAGRTLLRMALENLRAAGVRNVAVVVGYRKEEVIPEARAHSGGMRLKVLENPRYPEGAILSLWTARDVFCDDLLVMDADVLCPGACLGKLIRSPHLNCILVDGSSPDTGEEQMVLGRAGRVLHITKRPSAGRKAAMTSLGESVGFLKLSKKAAAVLRRLLEAKVRSGAVRIEHEQVYPALFRKVKVGFERVDGLPWIEIDTPEDLKRAEEEIFPRWRAAAGPTVSPRPGDSLRTYRSQSSLCTSRSLSPGAPGPSLPGAGR